LHQRIVHTLDWLNLDSLLGYSGKRAGAPERSRLALAQAFVAKAVLGFEQTTQLRSRLLVDTVLRRLLGFESNHPLPSEATFSRAFAQFARIGLPAKAHEALIRSHLGGSVIGHIARDSTAIHARESAQYSAAETAALNAAKAAKHNKVPKRKGRRPSRAAASRRNCYKPRSKRWPSCPSCATRGKRSTLRVTSTLGWATSCIWMLPAAACPSALR
jgi:hypothetical protein